MSSLENGESTVLRAPRPLDPSRKAELDEFLSAGLPFALPPSDALDEYIKASGGASFRSTLFEMIRRKGMDEVSVYTAAGVSRSAFSRIRSDENYKPTKRVALSFAFSLGLSLDSAEILLRSGGLALSPSDTSDLIARYYFENGPRNVNAVNDALFAYGQPLLAGVSE